MTSEAARLPEEAAIARVFRAEYGQAVATLVRVFGGIDIAEDVVQEARRPPRPRTGHRS